MRIRAGGASEVGKVRDHNEDFYGVDPKGFMFVLADGMGGHAAGEIASRLACEGIVRVLLPHREQLAKLADDGRPDSRQTLISAMRGAVVTAEKNIFDAVAAVPERKGMATTCDLVFLAAGTAFIAHVGDSRVYLLRGDTGRLLTVDHTVANYLKAQGKSPLEVAGHPHKDKLIRALGMSGGAEIDTLQLDLRIGDRLVLCSDGLYRYLKNPTHLAQLYGHREPQEAADTLCKFAIESGGEDNVTCICVEVLDPGVRPTFVETDSKISALGNITLFRNLGYQEMLQVMPITYEKRIEAGEVIIREGDPGEELYLLVQGTCDVRSGGISIASIGTGQAFGELALVDNRPRSATVVANENCRVLVIPRNEFERLTQTGPLATKLLWNVIHDLSERLRSASERLREQGKKLGGN
ncbi:MAG: cyclic nucleotide-binding domain-containing protein [Myxococcota bacterium]|jgi:serine/threonine protein phosphatase PrpC|nr:cyclic nucleotide-binding domain-containing protein [Myxococcota bacterium]